MIDEYSMRNNSKAISIANLNVYSQMSIVYG